MKKKLKSELVSLAHRILKMDATADYTVMQQEAKKLYETLTVLTFVDNHFDGNKPTITKAEIIQALEEKKDAETFTPKLDFPEDDQESQHRESELKEKEKAGSPESGEAGNPKTVKLEADPYRRENLNQDELYEPVMEKIKDMVAQMPPEADAIDEMFRQITDKPAYTKNDKDIIGEFGRLAQFEEPEKKSATENKPRRLNDSMSRGLSFGLNDRIAFIKNLFNGSAADYNRVLSQLNTATSLDSAFRLIDTMIKPDYNNWEGKEIYENRFKELVSKKFDN